MDLLRHWRRSTFGAAAGALLVPGAILIAALAVGVGGGGLGGLASLRQALNGPDLPRVAPLATRRPDSDAGRLLAQTRRRDRARARARQVAQARRTRSSAGSSRPSGASSSPATQQQTSTTTAPAAGAAPVSVAPPATPSPAPPAPQPTPPSAIKQVGNTVSGVANQVPVVGPTTGQAVDDIVDTVDAVIPPN